METKITQDKQNAIARKKMEEALVEKQIYSCFSEIIAGVISRKEVEDIRDIIPNNIAHISISNPGSTPVNQTSEHFLSMQFWDMEMEIGHYKPISDEEAEEIAKFIFKNIDRVFLVNCEAGQSRSAGVAMAIECIKLFNGSKYDFSISGGSCVALCPRYTPLLIVYDKIIKEYNKLSAK